VRFLYSKTDVDDVDFEAVERGLSKHAACRCAQTAYLANADAEKQQSRK